MTVILLLYLCADATHTDCQVLPAQLWKGPDAYEQCRAILPDLTKALTTPNRELHRLICEVQAENPQPSELVVRPAVTHQSFRM